MSAVLTPTRRPRLFRIYRVLRMFLLRAEIRSYEKWIDACKRDGIANTQNLRECDRKLEELRCELASWEAA